MLSYHQILKRFLVLFGSILHIKSKSVERAFQRHIIRAISTSKEGDMSVAKSVRVSVHQARVRVPQAEPWPIDRPMPTIDRLSKTNLATDRPNLATDRPGTLVTAEINNFYTFLGYFQ